MFEKGFNWNLISKWREFLMGLGIIGVMLGHLLEWCNAQGSVAYLFKPFVGLVFTEGFQLFYGLRDLCEQDAAVFLHGSTMRANLGFTVRQRLVALLADVYFLVHAGSPLYFSALNASMQGLLRTSTSQRLNPPRPHLMP